MLRRLSAITVAVTTALFTPALQAQTVGIEESGLRAYGDPIVLSTTVGSDGSRHAYLTIRNSCPFDIHYDVHIHDLARNFIRFSGSDGRDGDFAAPFSGVLNTSNDRQDVFPVYVRMRSGRPGIYQDWIGVEAWCNQHNEKLGYAQIPVIASFFHASVSGRSRPSGYDFLRNRKGQLLRCRLQDLPLSVSSADTRLRSGDKRRWAEMITQRSVAAWNSVGRQIGMSQLFKYVGTNRRADIDVVWNDANIPPGAAGVARTRGLNSGGRLIAGIGMGSIGRTGKDRADVAETLMQEMGHLLGLGHSQNTDDIMHPRTHAHTHRDLDYVHLSDRDLRALAWLYANEDCAWILPKRSIP